MLHRNFLTDLESYQARGEIPVPIVSILRDFFLSYTEAVENTGHEISDHIPLFKQYLDFVAQQYKTPYPFEPYHERLLSPINYYQFGLDFIRPLVQFDSSQAKRLDLADRMLAQLHAGDNVILLANHQTEPDPQAISLLLEKTHPQLAEEMIFVAGHRVVSDPLAIPFSLGRNLLCIFSKKYIENPPEKKGEKLKHNQSTMKKMSQLLAEGGKCIYVAPSGGRDRPDAQGHVDVAPFDPQSIEMFWLMAQQSERTTHFYPLALATYQLLPPPISIQQKLGEMRHAQSTPIHLAFDEEVDMEHFPGSEIPDKKERRQRRAQYIWEIVKRNYDLLEARS